MDCLYMVYYSYSTSYIWFITVTSYIWFITVRVIYGLLSHIFMQADVMCCQGNDALQSQQTRRRLSETRH